MAETQATAVKPVKPELLADPDYKIAQAERAAAVKTLAELDTEITRYEHERGLAEQALAEAIERSVETKKSRLVQILGPLAQMSSNRETTRRMIAAAEDRLAKLELQYKTEAELRQILADAEKQRLAAASAIELRTEVVQRNLGVA